MMSEIVYRPAQEQDRTAIASLIAHNFKREFDSFCRDSEKLAKAMTHAVVVECFYVAVMDGRVVGIVGVADSRSRALSFEKKELRKYFGALRVAIGYKIFQKELMKPFDYPAHKAFIDFVAVHPDARRRSVATNMIKYIFDNSCYDEYELYTMDDNHNARSCYEKLGFVEFKREKKKIDRIYMSISLPAKG